MDEGSSLSENGRYRLKIVSADSVSYTMSATGLNSQANDEGNSCMSLVVSAGNPGGTVTPTNIADSANCP